MIRRINEWVGKHDRSATCIILLPVFFITFLIEQEYFFAIIFFVLWLILVQKLLRYVKTNTAELEGTSREQNYIIESIEIDEEGGEHRIIREYNEHGEIVASTDSMIYKEIK